MDTINPHVNNSSKQNTLMELNTKRPFLTSTIFFFFVDLFYMHEYFACMYKPGVHRNHGFGSPGRGVMECCKAPVSTMYVSSFMGEVSKCLNLERYKQQLSVAYAVQIKKVFRKGK